MTMPNIFPTVRGLFVIPGAISCHESVGAHPETPAKTMATPARFERATGRLEGGGSEKNASARNDLRVAPQASAKLHPKIGGALAALALAACCPGVPPSTQEAADNWRALEEGRERVQERVRRERLDPADPDYLESDYARRRREANAWPLYVPGSSEPTDQACVHILNPSPAVDGIWMFMTWHRADRAGPARVSGDGATSPARADEGWRWQPCRSAP